MRKIIIDTDPGVDDAFAIISALLYEDFEVLGICSVAGNKGLRHTTDNVLRLLELMKSDIKVYRGAKHPFGEEACLDVDVSAHGKTGLGNTDLPFNYNNLVEDEEACDFILRMAKKYRRELEIITLGPMTDIALAVEKDRETMEGVKAIYSMGGGVHRGNVSPVAEFNYWYDPKSVEISYSLGDKVDIYMLGLDITNKVIFDLNDLYFIRKECGDLGQVLYDMAIDYVDVYWNMYRYPGCIIHDLIAVLFAIDDGKVFSPSGVHNCNMEISIQGISKGQTVVDLLDVWGGEKNSFIVLDVDAKKCKELFVKLLVPEKHDLYSNYVLK